MPDPASEPNRSLRGQVVILTGASAGLGAEFARSLAAAGARLVLAARRHDRLEALAAELPECEAVACDVTGAADRERLIERALERFGRIDCLVNNAGATNVKPAVKESDEDLRRILAVNLEAPFCLARDVAAHLREAGHGGAIVNVSSVSASRSYPHLPQAAYVAAKGGLSALTRELALQWARYGIRVNAIAPGVVLTEMTADQVVEGPVADHLRETIPLGRVGQAEELNGALLLLLSDAGCYITGSTITVDGGWAL